MTPASKGRWVGFATVAVVTVAWTLASGDFGTTDVSSVVLAGGIYVGIPYGLLAGSLLGRLAGRLQRFRGLVVVEALAWWLPIEVPASRLIGIDPSSRSAVMIGSLVPTLVAALVIERWARPVELVPRAAVLRV
ncbi:MAG TPA: hypothetical protein VGL61_18300 [Kofleriaceae bacterium]|jgi:hypothetical protein